MLPIIDAHQHLWDLSKFCLPWLKTAEPLQKDHLMSDYLAATDGLSVVKTVYMEVDVDPKQRLAEAAYVIELSLRDDNPMAGAVISGSPEAFDFKDYIDRFKGCTYIKGVRQVLHIPEKGPSACLDSAFIAGVQYLGRVGLSFDICLRPAELADGVKLAAQCPDTQFILDHCGNPDPNVINGADPGPNDGSNPFWHEADQWWQDLAALAEQPNVVCKISGIVARASEHWSAVDLAATINHCLDSFGPDRVIFGGDWPVCTLAATYREWATALREVIKDRSEEDQRKLLHDNAVRLYRLA